MKDDYAFIEYENTNSAIEAINEMHGQPFRGNRLVVEAAKPKNDEQVTNTRLYVGNFHLYIYINHILYVLGRLNSQYI